MSQGTSIHEVSISGASTQSPSSRIPAIDIPAIGIPAIRSSAIKTSTPHRAPLFALLLCAASIFTLGGAEAQAEIPGIPNVCDAAGGAGDPCQTSADCAFKPYATVCVEHNAGDISSRRCEIPCAAESDSSKADYGACSAGETCIQHAAKEPWFCKASRFRVDLNLVDQCVSFFLSGRSPSLGSSNQCSLEANLARLLDQNSDGVFDIFDVDACVNAFLDQPSCDSETGTCAAEDLLFCNTDSDCGDGLFCDEDRNACVRECGILASREPGVPAIERGCSGRLKTCDFERGRCEPAEIEELTCAIDRDCPSGAYCFLGRCAPTCSRSLDCPDSSWFCSDNAQCRVLPPPDAPSGFVFEPARYALLSGTGGLTLDEIENVQQAPVHIMDLVTKREVKDNSAIAFGYRLEVNYAFKDDPLCRKDPASWTLEEKEECVLDPSREFVQPLEPFGTLVAKSSPGIAVALNMAAVDRLTPGSYNATVTVTFDNGNQLRFPVSYKKTTPSGEYGGSMSVYLERPENALDGGERLPLEMRIKVHQEQTITWDDLLAQENLPAGRDIIDLTSGYLVTGSIHGNSSVAFAQPQALRPGDNEIPLKGIYSPQSGLLRLVSVIDLPGNFCVGGSGSCAYADPDEVQVHNPFGRDIRRMAQFFGTFESGSKRFFGLYRERISGLVPGQELTLDGSFQLSQTLFDDSAQAASGPLLAAGAVEPRFPSNAQVLADLNADIDHYCLDEDGRALPEVAHFANQKNYRNYLNSSFPELRDYTQFKELLQRGLDSLSTAERGDAVLTLHEFLAGRVVLCEDRESLAANAPVTSTAPACVREQRMRCGLALYRKAILASYVSGGDLAAAGKGEHQLFCVDSMPTEGCNHPPQGYPTLRTLQEHNRFFNELSQSTKFLADKNLSDAFFAMYRHRLNPFTQGAALNFKADRLHDAYSLYEELLELAVSTPSAAVLFRWPMDVFQGSGAEWLRQFQVLVRDRLDAQIQLVDLRRRIFASTGQSDQMLGEHLGHQEFLVQIYLAALQRQWEGESFLYSGEAPRALDKIRTVQLQLNESKNPLGITPERVFFESSDPSRPNWQNYLAHLSEDQGGGLLGKARREIDSAVSNLQNSLRDVDALENAIHKALRGTEERIDELCGPEIQEIEEVCGVLDDLVFEVKNGTLAPEKLAEAASRTCPVVVPGFAVGQNPCKQVVTQFGESWDYKAACPLNATWYRTTAFGKDRSCIGGKMSVLLTEGEALRADLKSNAGKLESLQKEVFNFVLKYQFEEAIALAQSLKAIITEAVQFALELSKHFTTIANDASKTFAEGANCMFIGGFAVGTSCPMSVASAAGRTALTVVKGVAVATIDTAKSRMEGLKKLANEQIENLKKRREAAAEIDTLVGKVDEISKSWNATFDQLIENEIETQKLRLELRDIEDRLNADLSLIMDQLVGRETGSVLVGDYLVRRSATTFRRVLDTSYRMVLAFSHRYDLPKAEEQAYLNRVLQAVTLEDIEELVDDLRERGRTYCSREAIDCDAFNNLSVLRVSLRDELFPDLRDIVDPVSGKVITRGEQFHNIITSPPFLRRRVRGVWTANQIEIPFTVNLLARDGSGGESWLINPTQCGHVLDGDPSGPLGERGTLAVNAVGKNLGDGSKGIFYELARGHIDQVRSCRSEVVQGEVGTMPVQDYPINIRLAGYAPESIEGQSSAPPTYVTRSAELAACVNEAEKRGELDGGECWQFFARDRSLASPDWLLTLPLSIGGASTSNAWLAGEGLPEQARPVIEDLIVYLRYRSRPIGEADR